MIYTNVDVGIKSKSRKKKERERERDINKTIHELSKNMDCGPARSVSTSLSGKNSPPGGLRAPVTLAKIYPIPQTVL